jgi:hypothetical protein
MALDPVNAKAVKGKFKDREDKDLDNDGDSDASDEYLHKRRSAVSKAIKSVKEAAPKIGVDNVAKIRAQDHANKPAKVKPMNSTQRSLASIRAKSESVEEAKMTPDQMRKALDDDKANAKSKDKVSLKKAPWDMKESVELDEAKRDASDFEAMDPPNGIDYDDKNLRKLNWKMYDDKAIRDIIKRADSNADERSPHGPDYQSSGKAYYQNIIKAAKAELKKRGIKEEVELDEANLSQQQRDRLDDLIFNVMITGNIEYDGKDNPTRHLKTIEKEFGPKVAKQVEAGMDIKNWGRDNRSSGIDSLALRKKSRISASGKMNKQDAVALGKRIMQDKSFGGLTKKVKLPEDTQIDEKYDTPVKKKPVSMMTKDEKDKNDERRKSYKEYQKSLRKEDTQIDEAISGDQYYYVDPKGVVVAVGNKDSMRKMNMKQAKDGNKGGSFSQNRKKYKVGDKINESVKIDEISMGKMAAYAPKAVKSRNDAKAATHSADSNRVANAKKVIAKRKAGADNYNKKMWGYSNVAPTKESVSRVLSRMVEAKDNYTIAHKTFSSAVQHAEDVTKKRGFEIDPDVWDRKVAMGPRKPGVGKTNSYNIDLMKNGKDVKQKLHMQVYYDEGRYELNMYIS